MIIASIAVFCAAVIAASKNPAAAASETLKADGSLVPQMISPKILDKAKEGGYTSVENIRKQYKEELGAGRHFKRFINGNRKKKRIALTIDDGPHPRYTPELLEILKEHNVKATFFVVGEMAEKYPDLIKMEVAAGHEIGNHTYHHVNLKKIPEDYIAAEIKECDAVIRRLTGKSTQLFRPPGGYYNKNIADVSGALGYTLILWTADAGDYASPGENVIIDRLLRKTDNGAVIIIHDGVRQTVEALPKIIEKLKSRGYVFVTVSELMKQK
ncbi:MAG: polysaccharide deacetylase family protein [bacterium]